MTQPVTLTFKDRLSIALLRLCARLPLPLLQYIGRLIGRLVANFTSNGTYRTVHTNLQLCFPEKPAEWHREMAHASLLSTGMTALEFAKAWGMPPAYSLGMIREVHGLEHFEAALAAGKGVIAVVPHWGNWEFMNAWLNQYVAPVIMYKPGDHPGVDALVVEARSRLRTTVVPTDESGVRATFKALRQGGFTAILPDHIPQENGGVQVPFFGITTLTGVIVPKLASRTGCAVIQLACMRRADGNGFDVHVLPADPDIGHEDVVVGAAAMNRSMETLIRMAPEQYQWTYKRFKRNESLLNPYR